MDNDNGSEPYNIAVRKGPPVAPVQSEPGSGSSTREPNHADSTSEANTPGSLDNPSEVYQLNAPPSASSVLDQGPLVPSQPPQTRTLKPPKQPFHMTWRRMAAVALVVLSLVAGVLLVLHNISASNKQAALNASLTDQSARIKTQAVALSDLGQQLHADTSQTANTLTVNGSLALAPTMKPNNAVAGQLYYNQSTNQLGYYDGTNFVYLNGGGTSVNNYATYVNNVTNQAPVTEVSNNTTIIQGGGVSALNGTAGDIALFSAPDTLGDSLITQSGTAIAISGSTDSLNGATVTINGGTTTIGSNSVAANSVDIDAGTGASGIQIGNSATNHTIGIGTGAGDETVTIGSPSSSSATSLQGGTGGLLLDTGTATGITGTVTIESGNSSTTASGNVTIDTGNGFISGTVVYDDGFEDGVDHMNGWTGGAVTTQNCTIGHTGSCSLAVTGNAFWGILQDNNAVNKVPITAGHHYNISVWVRAGTTPVQIAGALIWNVGSFDTSYLTMPTTTDTTTGWTHITVTGIAPAGATLGEFRFGGVGGASPGGTQYFDDLTVTDLSSGSTSSELDLGSANAQIINIGNMNETEATTIDGGSGIDLDAGAANLNVTGGAVVVSGSGASSFETTSGSLTLGSGGSTGGGVIVKPQANSTTDFQVQSAGDASNLLTVDSTNNAVSLGLASGSSFGNTYVGSNVGSIIGNGSLEGFKFTTSAAGTLGALSVNIGTAYTTSPNNQYQLAIYSDNGGSPGTYLGSTAIGAITANGWSSLPLVAPVSVLANTNYWLVFWANGNQTITYSTGYSSNVAASSSSTWQGGADNGLPAAFPVGSTSTGSLYSIYASYTSTSPALMINSLGTLTQSGAALFQDATNSTQAFQIQNSTDTPLLTADTANMVITVGGSLTVTGTISVDGHIITGGNTPMIAPGAAACTTPTVNIAGDDTSGTITVTTGTGCSGGGSLATVTFVSAFGATPHVTLTPDGASAAALNAYNNYSSLSVNGFSIGTAATPSTSTTYIWNYLVIQ